MPTVSKEVFTFVEVARWQSVRKAAERLNVSASALSRQLRILEDALGAQLVTRHASGIHVTQAGQRYLAHVKQMIALDNALRDDIRETDGSRQLRVRVGVAESISRALAMRLRAHYERIGQDVRLDIVVDGTDGLVTRLAAGQLDAVVTFNMTTDERLRHVDTFEAQVGMVCASSLLDDVPSSIALADCLGWPLCLPGEGISILPRLMSEISRQERAFTIAATSNSFATLCAMIADGAGVGFMTIADVMAHEPGGRLLFVPLKDRRLTEQVGFAIAHHIRLNSDLGKALMPIGGIVSAITSGGTAQKFDNPAS